MKCVINQGWLKSAILGGSSFKDLVSSLEGCSYKETNPVPRSGQKPDLAAVATKSG